MTSMTLTLRWMPGTTDRVLARSPLGRGEIRVHDVRRVLGRTAIEDLYLRGVHTVVRPEASLWFVMVCLGITPDDTATVAVTSGPAEPPDLLTHALPALPRPPGTEGFGADLPRPKPV